MPESPQVAEADARSLTKKLAAFSKTLTPGEQAALRQVIQRSVGGEVQGFAAWDPSDANAWWTWWSWNWSQ